MSRYSEELMIFLAASATGSNSRLNVGAGPVSDAGCQMGDAEGAVHAQVDPAALSPRCQSCPDSPAAIARDWSITYRQETLRYVIDYLIPVELQSSKLPHPAQAIFRGSTVAANACTARVLSPITRRHREN
jgi:hypothetical protein